MKPVLSWYETLAGGGRGGLKTSKGRALLLNSSLVCPKHHAKLKSELHIQICILPTHVHTNTQARLQVSTDKHVNMGPIRYLSKMKKNKIPLHTWLRNTLPLLFEHVQKTTYKSKIQFKKKKKAQGKIIRTQMVWYRAYCAVNYTIYPFLKRSID